MKNMLNIHIKETGKNNEFENNNEKIVNKARISIDIIYVILSGLLFFFMGKINFYCINLQGTLYFANIYAYLNKELYGFSIIFIAVGIVLSIVSFFKHSKYIKNLFLSRLILSILCLLIFFIVPIVLIKQDYYQKYYYNFIAFGAGAIGCILISIAQIILSLISLKIKKKYIEFVKKDRNVLVKVISIALIVAIIAIPLSISISKINKVKNIIENNTFMCESTLRLSENKDAYDYDTYRYMVFNNGKVEKYWQETYYYDEEYLKNNPNAKINGEKESYSTYDYKVGYSLFEGVYIKVKYSTYNEIYFVNYNNNGISYIYCSGEVYYNEVIINY